MQNCLAVILAAGRGSRMYPLTEECPKCLLPVVNRPLIWYPLKLLERRGFREAVVVVREAESRAVSEILNQLVSGGELAISLVTIPDSEDWGTADSLRHLRGKVLKPQHSDVLVVSCDLVTSVPLHLLTEFHSCHYSTLTCLLSHPLQEDLAHRKCTTAAECDIIGLTSEQQLVYFAAQADLDDCVTLSKALLKRYPHIRVSSQLTDAHLYLMRRWVLDYLVDNKHISSVKGELVPHMVRHQWMQADGRSTTGSANRLALQMHAGSCADQTEQLALQMSSFAGYKGQSDGLMKPLLTCYALEVSEQLCLRVNSIASYMEVNRLSSHFSSDIFQSAPQLTLQRPKGISGDCTLGEGVQLGDRVSVKHSAIGNHCHIGDRSKVTNTVMMDHVVVGEGVSLQSCVVCSHVHIEDRVTLKDCLLGANFTVTREADVKGETLVSGGGLHF